MVTKSTHPEYIHDYYIARVIAKSEFSTVYEALNDEKQIVALKVYNKFRLQKEK